MSGYHRQGEPDIIDMKRSGIDKKDWKEVMSGTIPDGWKQTRKVVPASYAKASNAIRPLWKFEWNINKTEHINNWALKFGHTLVMVDDGYWPEGIPPDSKGNFIRGDLIFVKVTVEDFLERRKDEIKRGNIGRKIVTQQFQNTLKHTGAQVSDEEVTKALGW